MIDSHAHVTFSSYDDDRKEVIARAREAGLSGWIEVGTTLAESKKAISLTEQEEGVYATVGVHPSDIAGLTEDDWRELAELATHEKVKAIGEIGLDFYRGGDAKEQKGVVERFISIAEKEQLPVVFHVRDGKDVNAHEELLQLLRSLAEPVPGVIHTYSGTKAQAEKYLQLGMYLSFSGVVTFKNAGEILDVAATMPLDNMLIETDCPFLTPVPHRGKRNEPAYVAYVADKIADLRGISTEEIRQATAENTKRLFCLDCMD